MSKLMFRLYARLALCVLVALVVLASPILFLWGIFSQTGNAETLVAVGLWGWASAWAANMWHEQREKINADLETLDGKPRREK